MMTNRKLLALLFLSFAFLGACSNTKNHTGHSSKNQLSQGSKKKKDTISSESSPTKSSSSTSAKSETFAPKLEIPAAEQDLDIAAINQGDITTLVGKWQNGRGETVIVNPDQTVKLIDIDGISSNSLNVYTVPDSENAFDIPYVAIGEVRAIATLNLYPIDFSNPNGDQSDVSRPRLVLTQNTMNFPADLYYYRVN